VPYTVKTPVFEGPFDLLLHLITREQVDLWEISLSAIVDRYVATLEEMRAALDLDVATEFLLIASVLLELKARRLLPGRESVESDEELALWEERDLLLARLLECKTFKDAAAAMSRAMDSAALSKPRVAGLDERFSDLVPDVLAGVTPDLLRQAMEQASAPRPRARVILDHVAPVRASVADAVAVLLDELPRSPRTTFTRLTTGISARLEVIVRFLALLEMFKQGVVDLRQTANFGELEVSWIGSSSTPGSSGSIPQGSSSGWADGDHVHVPAVDKAQWEYEG
jgi:segregation and condensation protein A